MQQEARPIKKRRYVKLTNARIAAALGKSAGMITTAAAALGCHTSAIYRRLDRSPSLRAVLGETRERSLDLAESRLLEAIDRGELTAIIFYLKTLGKRRGYTEKIEVDVRQIEEAIVAELERITEERELPTPYVRPENRYKN